MVHWEYRLSSPVWRLYGAYRRFFPIDRGKYRLSKALFRVIGPQAVRIGDIRLELHPNSLIDEELIRAGHFEPDIEGLIAQRIVPGTTFIDVGANLGWFSLQAAGRGGIAYAFEPSPPALARLRRNVELNSTLGVNIRPVALGAKSGQLILGIASELNLGLSSLRSSFNSDRTVPVSVRTLDEEVPSDDLARCSLVKIDVEGWELEVLKGFERSMPLLRNAHFVVEVTGPWLSEAGGSVEDLYRFFHRWGLRGRHGIGTENQYTEVFEPRD